MQDYLKRAVSLGLGALLVTREKVEEVVNELVKKGEVGQEEGKKLISKLIEKGEKNKKKVEAQIGGIAKGVAEKLNIPTRKELNELKSEIKQLRKKLNKK